MPIYEFECRSCGERFEAYCPIGKTDEVRCPRCNKKKLQQLVSTFSSRSSGPLAPAGKACSRRS